MLKNSTLIEKDDLALNRPHVQLFDLVISLSHTVDLVSPLVADHHQRVAYIALSLGLEMNLPEEELHNLVLAAALHDIGALSLQERLDALHFETITPQRHSETGYLLLQMFQPLSAAAELIRFHHVPWNNGQGREWRGLPVPGAAHILHLADRIDVLSRELYEVRGKADRHPDPLSRVEHVVSGIRKQAGRMFVPEMVDIFRGLAEKEYFWFDLVSPDILEACARYVKPQIIPLTEHGTAVSLVSQIIDFRSSFTATHSAGVAAAAETLARLYGFSEAELPAVRVAGYLHDLGKLAVPAEILEKPGVLTPQEYNIIKSHTYHTHRVLKNIRGLAAITAWASFHHERLDGQGYPFRLKGKQLSPGSRIMAVADVFAAVTEDRPYRPGMSPEGALSVLREMAGDALEPDIVALVHRNYDELAANCEAARKEAADRYRTFRANLPRVKS